MTLSLNEKLWQFALDVYGVEGVAAECVDVQDRYGVDVCLLLAAGFAAEAGLAPDAEVLRRWNGVVANWRETVIAPLRKVRRDLKQEAANCVDVADLRRAVQAAELQAERRELDMLASEIAGFAGAGASDRPHDEMVQDTLAKALGVFTTDAVATPLLLSAMRGRRT